MLVRSFNDALLSLFVRREREKGKSQVFCFVVFCGVATCGRRGASGRRTDLEESSGRLPQKDLSSQHLTSLSRPRLSLSLIATYVLCILLQKVYKVVGYSEHGLISRNGLIPVGKA